MSIHHDTKHSRFVLNLSNKDQPTDADLAIVEYAMHEDVRIAEITHTYVPPEHRGRGFAAKVTKYALDYFTQQGYVIRPTCTYTQRYVSQHASYQALVESSQ